MLPDAQLPPLAARPALAQVPSSALELDPLCSLACTLGLRTCVVLRGEGAAAELVGQRGLAPAAATGWQPDVAAPGLRWLPIADAFGVVGELGFEVVDAADWHRLGAPLVELAAVAAAALRSRQRLLAAEDRAVAAQARSLLVEEFVASSEVGMHSLGPDGTILWANERAAALVGCSLGDYVGRNIREFHVEPEGVPAALQLLGRGERLRDARFAVRHRDGSVRQLSCNSVGHFENGRFVSTRCCLRDVSALGDAPAGLHSSERQFRRLADHVPVLMWENDARGERTFCNRAWLGFTGRTLAEEQGLGWTAGIHPDDVAMTVDAFARALVARREFVVEYRLRRADGESRWVRDSGAPRYDEQGEFDGFVGCTIDVTEVRAAQAERLTVERRLGEAQKLESLASLAGGVAHDFNNLLTGVLGYCGLLRDSLPAEPTASELLHGIEQAAQRASDLCGRMLAYSGRGRFTVRPVALSTIVRDHQNVLPMCAGREIVVDLQLDEQLPAVSADATQLGQVLMNLVVNAAEASAKGGLVRVRTSQRRLGAAELRPLAKAPTTQPGDFVCLEVSDAGVGMTAAVLARAFDPFFSTKGPGRGLGLSAVLGIVRGHGGAIAVETQPGRGCTITVFLPLQSTPEATVVVPVPEPRGGGAVLVVDDEEIVRSVAVRTLARAGYEVVAVGDGATALLRFEQEPHRFALALVDHTMPGLTGAQVAAGLRRQRPGLPIVMTSGYDRTDLAQRHGLEVDAFLAKPFGPAELLQVIAAQLAAAGTAAQVSSQASSGRTTLP